MNAPVKKQTDATAQPLLNHTAAQHSSKQNLQTRCRHPQVSRDPNLEARERADSIGFARRGRDGLLKYIPDVRHFWQDIDWKNRKVAQLFVEARVINVFPSNLVGNPP